MSEVPKWRHNAARIQRRLEPPYPRTDLAHVAVAGRSNVGKSSLLNRLLARKHLAGVGKQPGKTRSLDFFLVGERLVLCDLPGYGYAAVATTLRERWGQAIERYLTTPPGPRVVLLLVDGRHEPTAMDIDLAAFLRAHHLPYRIVLTKADKVPRGKRTRHAAAIAAALNMGDEPPLWTSAHTGEGIDKLWALLKPWIA